MRSGGGGGATCARCGAAGATKRCGGCKGVMYCSAACQRRHWAAHKAACSAVSAALARAAAHVARGLSCAGRLAVVSSVALGPFFLSLTRFVLDEFLQLCK